MSNRIQAPISYPDPVFGKSCFMTLAGDLRFLLHYTL